MAGRHARQDHRRQLLPPSHTQGTQAEAEGTWEFLFPPLFTDPSPAEILKTATNLEIMMQGSLFLNTVDKCVGGDSWLHVLPWRECCLMSSCPFWIRTNCCSLSTVYTTIIMLADGTGQAQQEALFRQAVFSLASTLSQESELSKWHFETKSNPQLLTEDSPVNSVKVKKRNEVLDSQECFALCVTSIGEEK